MENRSAKTRRLVLLAMLLAVIVTLSALEHMLPPLPALPPNVRLGLSNIVTMYTLFFLGKREAALLTALKSAFVALMRGAVAGLLSLCGGALSILVIILLSAMLRERVSYLALSVSGAIAHNLGQLLAASALLGTGLWLYYLPVLVVSGAVMGSVTAALLRAVMPLFRRVLPGGGEGRT